MLVETVLAGEGGPYEWDGALEQLSTALYKGSEEVGELALWGIGEIAKEGPDKGIRDLALDRLDWTAKYGYSGKTRKAASDVLRAALKA